MGAVLRRAASSPNIKERADCSAALFTAAGELLVQAEHIPVHLGSMPASVAAAIAHRRVARRQLILNDPFAGGTHLNDITLVAPVLRRRARSSGWVANRAHHADVGGTAPGSMPPDALDIDQEGLRIPPVPVDDRVTGARRRARRARPTSGAATSTPSAAPTGSACADWPSSCARCGVASRALFAEILDYGERRMRAALRDLPDGRGRSTTCSTRPARVPSSSARPASWSRCASSATTSPSTSPAPTRSGRATSTRSRP